MGTEWMEKNKRGASEKFGFVDSFAYIIYEKSQREVSVCKGAYGVIRRTFVEQQYCRRICAEGIDAIKKTVGFLQRERSKENLRFSRKIEIKK